MPGTCRTYFDPKIDCKSTNFQQLLHVLHLLHLPNSRLHLEAVVDHHLAAEASPSPSASVDASPVTWSRAQRGSAVPPAAAPPGFHTAALRAEPRGRGRSRCKSPANGAGWSRFPGTKMVVFYKTWDATNKKLEILQNQFFYQQKCEVDPLKWGTWGLLYK